LKKKSTTQHEILKYHFDCDGGSFNESESRAISQEYRFFRRLATGAKLAGEGREAGMAPFNRFACWNRSNGYDPNLLNNWCVPMKYILCELSSGELPCSSYRSSGRFLPKSIEGSPMARRSIISADPVLRPVFLRGETDLIA
jgi:hypothetical protein